MKYCGEMLSLFIKGTGSNYKLTGYVYFPLCWRVNMCKAVAALNGRTIDVDI